MKTIRLILLWLAGTSGAFAAWYTGTHDYATSNAVLIVPIATNPASPVRLDQISGIGSWNGTNTFGGVTYFTNSGVTVVIPSNSFLSYNGKIITNIGSGDVTSLTVSGGVLSLVGGTNIVLTAANIHTNEADPVFSAWLGSYSGTVTNSGGSNSVPVPSGDWCLDCGTTGSGYLNGIHVSKPWFLVWPEVLPNPEKGFLQAWRMQDSTNIFVEQMSAHVGFPSYFDQHATFTTLSANNGTFTTLNVGSGGLTVAGNITYNLMVNNVTYTNIYAGTVTNYNLSVVITQYVYEVAIVERRTNIIDTQIGQVFNNSYLNATNALWVGTPHFMDTRDANLVANGTWDFTGATLLGVSGGDGITTNDVYGLIGSRVDTNRANAATTNSASSVSGLTLTTSSGIVTLGGSIPASGDALTTNNVHGIIASQIDTNMAKLAITNSASSVTGITLTTVGGIVTLAGSETSKADSNKSVTVVLNGVTNSVVVGVGGVIDLGTLATVTGSVSYASNAGSLNGIPGSSYLTNAATINGATNLVLNQARWSIVGASTATRAGSDYRWLQLLSNSTVYALEVVMPSTWTNKQSITIHSIAPSGVATNTFALYSMPCDTTTNIPTAWTATNFVTAISGVASTSNLVTQIGAGLNCLMLSNQTGNASTSWISNVEFRFAP